MEERDYMCVVWERRENGLYRFCRGLLYILLLTEHCPESYIMDTECVLKLRLENASVHYIKADQI